MTRVIIEMGGGRKGEVADGFRESLVAPDWVKLALLEYQGTSTVRMTYGDESFSEWRMRAVR